MTKDTISIIIPVFNVATYLDECLNSIICQTYKKLEIICVNDGSTDNSLDILQKYASKDDRIIIINKENGGYASAINAGLDIASGEFIQIVESDDFCASSICEEMYNKISNSDADFVTSDFYFLKRKQLKICEYLNKSDQNIDFFNLKTLPYIIEKQAYPWKNLYRTSFLKDNNIRMLQDGKGAYEDQPWNATILSKANKILYVNKPLYYYRLDANGSSTNNGKKGLINYIKRKEQTKIILEENNLYNDKIKEHYCNSAVGGCLFFFKRIAFEYKEEFYNEMKSFFKRIIEPNLEYKYFSKKNKKRLKKILEKNYKDYCWNIILEQKIMNIFNLAR